MKMGGRNLTQKKKRYISVSFSVPEEDEATLQAFDKIARELKSSNRSRELIHYMRRYVRKYTIGNDAQMDNGGQEVSEDESITQEPIEKVKEITEVQTTHKATGVEPIETQIPSNEEKVKIKEEPEISAPIENEGHKISYNNIKSDDNVIPEVPEIIEEESIQEPSMITKQEIEEPEIEEPGFVR